MSFMICLCVILTLDIFTIFFGTVAFLDYKEALKDKDKEIKELKDYVKELEEAVK